MRPTLSDNAVAVLTLLNAQRHVDSRFDGSWWILNFAMWKIIPRLQGEEWNFAHALIDLGNRRRADSVTIANRPGLTHTAA